MPESRLVPYMQMWKNHLAARVFRTSRFLALLMLAAVPAKLSLADAKLQQNPTPPQSIPAPKPVAGILPALASAPPGKSTVIGGAIRVVDPVRDQLTLKVFGGKSMKILFDERTQFYRDGKKTSLRDLRPVNHASVETVLDGTSVFARSIHILSHAPGGECQGQVLSYNPGTGELTVTAALSHEPIELRVPAGTPFGRAVQTASSSADAGVSSLVKGTLVRVKFKSGNDGRGIATHVEILATPGSVFVFSGDVSFLDLHANLVVIVDPRDNQSYKISFDPALFPMSRDLRQGMHVSVTAKFDGTRYVANAITVK